MTMTLGLKMQTLPPKSPLPLLTMLQTVFEHCGSSDYFSFLLAY